MSPSDVLVETRVDGNTVTVVRYAPFQELETHAHGEEGLTIVLHGTFLEESVRGTLVAPTGSVATRPYGMTHTNRFGSAGVVILAVIPDRDRFFEPIREWSRADIPSAFRAGLRLIARDEDALSELFAAIGPSARPDRTVALRARRLLDDPEHCVTVSALARAMNIHPVYLAREFRRTFGMSLREYRTTQLVKRAATLVVGTKAPLSQIAHECGFADHSHMCRAFHRVAGLNPSRLRGS